MSIGSGQVSIGDIRTELLNTGTNNFSLKSAGRPTTGVPGTFQNPIYTPVNQSSTSKPNDSAPYAISEWRNYNHSENLACSGAPPTPFTTPTLGTFYTYYRVNIAGTSENESLITIVGNSTSNHWAYIFTSYPFDNVGAVTATAFTYSFFSGSTTKTFRKGISGGSPQVLHFVFFTDGN